MELKMTMNEAMKARHSVRSYVKKQIPDHIIAVLREKIAECNKESGLHIQLVTNEPKAFDGTMAHYGKFSGVENYIALVGQKNAELDEKCGYYGEQIVLLAQQLGLNTCWVALTFSKIKDAYKVDSGEKLCLVISLGYGQTQGIEHKSKPMEKLYKVNGDMPEWFRNGMKAAMLAPTAVNQQKFIFSINGSQVSAKAGMAFYSKVDLGIVKYHFELGAGKENFTWA